MTTAPIPITAPCADPQRLARLALANDGARANVRMVADVDVAVALHPWGKGHEIADDAVMLDVGVEIGVEMMRRSGCCW